MQLTGRQSAQARRHPSDRYLLAALIIAAIATLGSLYFSEIAGFAPCVLCWYQRSMMYPLVIVLFVGSWRRDPHLPAIALPLAIIGLLIAVYHSLLYYGVLPAATQSCSRGISCTTEYIEWFDFISIPLLSAAAFLGIIVALLLAVRAK